MATSCLSPETIARIRTVYAETGSTIETARRLGINKSSVLKYRDVVPTVESMTPRIQYDPRDVAFTVTMPEPAPEAGGVTMPDPVELKYEPFKIDTPGHWLTLNDVHIPYHDRRTLDAAVKESRGAKIAGIMLNGDIMDHAGISDHLRSPSVTRLEDEIDKTVQFFTWVRSMFPAARIVYKEGNHEFRLPRYIINYAPELFGVKQLQLPRLLELDKFGVEWVDAKRVVKLGKLPLLHGHEYKGGGGVAPARWLLMRTRTSAMCGHFHRNDSHQWRDLDGKVHMAWTIGCACFLSPDFFPLNDWVNGYAMTEVFNDGRYHVRPRVLLRDGTVA